MQLLQRRRFWPALLIGLAISAQAQPKAELGMPVLRNYPPKEYNGSPQVWSILQDRRGVLYFGTSDGAIEYDGVSWRAIRVPSSTVRSFAMDSTGRIWVGASSNFGYLEPDANGTLQYVSLLDKIPPEQRNFNDVWQVLITSHGNFFRSYEHLFRWDGKNMHVWTTNSRFHALSEVRGRIYTSQTGIGLQEIVGDDLRGVPGGAAYKDSTKLFLYPYDDRRILVSARAETLTLYDGEKVVPFPTQADDYLRKYEVYNSTPLPDGGFFLTTLRGGAVIVERDGRLRRVLDKDAGLQNDSVLTAYSDREGALWLGLGSGITRVDIDSPVSIFSRWGEDYARHNGSIYIATSLANIPLARLIPDPTNGLPMPHAIPGRFSQAFFLLSFRDPAGKGDQLLAATGFGVMKIDGDTATAAVPGLEGLTEGANSLLQSRKSPNRVYIGHFDGVSSIRWDGGRWIDEGRLPNFVNTVQSLAEDTDGALFAGANSFVLRVEVPPEGMRAAKAERITEAAGLTKGDIVVAFAAGSIFATPTPTKNLLRWDRSARKFVPDNRFLLPLKDPETLPALYELANGDIMAVNTSPNDQRQGMFRRKPDGTYTLDEEPFRRLSRFNIFRVRSEPDGDLWFSGTDGVMRFDQRVKSSGQESFSTLVRRVSSSAKDTVFGGTPAAGASALSLTHDRNSLHFEFAAPTFGSEGETTYQYFLEGADKDWSAWGKQRDANYSSLGPGSYRFHVRARTLEGRTGDEGVYSFSILPPWYRTTFAYSVYFLLFLIAAVGARQRVITHEREKARRETEALEAQAKALEATVAERTQEIRTQATEIAAQKDHLQQAYETVELLSEIGKEITASLDLDTILFKLYERVNQIVDASIFGVGLYRPQKNVIEYSLAIENGRRYAPYTRDASDKNQFAVWCIENRKPVLINDVEKEFQKYISSYQHGKRTLRRRHRRAAARVDDLSSAHCAGPSAGRAQHSELQEKCIHRAASEPAPESRVLHHDRARQRRRVPADQRTRARNQRPRRRTCHHQPHHPGAHHAARQGPADPARRRSGSRRFSCADRLCLAAGPLHHDARFSVYLRRGCRVAALRRGADVADHP